MKIQTFNAENTPKFCRQKESIVSFNKSGTIRLSKILCETMAIKPGSKISLSQDQDNPQDWYLHEDPKNGFEVRGKKDAGIEEGMMFNHTSLKNLFLNCFNLDIKTSYKFRVATEPTKVGKINYYGILIDSNTLEDFDHSAE